MSIRGQHSSVGTGSVSTIFNEEFPLTLEPKIEKLSFGSNYAIQGIPLTETVGFYNGTDSTYKLKVTPVESSKFQLNVDEEKFVLKKGERIQVKVTLLFNKHQSMGLTGQVQFSCKKKSIIGKESIVRALRFQLEGVVPAYNDKDLVKVNDEEQFRIGECNGVLSSIKGEQCVAFKYDVKDKYQKEDYEFIQKVYKDIHHQTILGMIGIVLTSSTILLDGDTTTDLETMMKKEKLSVQFLLQCASDCATALSYLASHNIIHRNVKPSKLRVVHHDLTNEGKSTVKLHDLTTIYKLKKGELIKKSPGTYQYMAPEVMEMKEHGLPIDVYSFGMTLYHIFTGTMPFDGLSNPEIQTKVIAGERLPLTDNNLPKGMDVIIERCWQQDPSERPQFHAINSKLNDIIKDYSILQ